MDQQALLIRFLLQRETQPCSPLSTRSCKRGIELALEQDLVDESCSSTYAQLLSVDNTRQHPRSTIAAAYSHDGCLVASTHGDHTVKISHVENGQTQAVLQGHSRTPWVVRFNPAKPNTVASGSLDHEVVVWDTSTGNALQGLNFGKPIATLAFHPAGDIMAVASGHKVYIWDYVTSPQAAVPVLKTRKSLRAVHFHPLGAPVLLTAEVVERKTTAQVSVEQASQAAPPEVLPTEPSEALPAGQAANPVQDMQAPDQVTGDTHVDAGDFQFEGGMLVPAAPAPAAAAQARQHAHQHQHQNQHEDGHINIPAHHHHQQHRQLAALYVPYVHHSAEHEQWETGGLGEPTTMWGPFRDVPEDVQLERHVRRFAKHVVLQATAQNLGSDLQITDSHLGGKPVIKSVKQFQAAVRVLYDEWNASTGVGTEWLSMVSAFIECLNVDSSSPDLWCRGDANEAVDTSSSAPGSEGHVDRWWETLQGCKSAAYTTFQSHHRLKHDPKQRQKMPVQPCPDAPSAQAHGQHTQHHDRMHVDDEVNAGPSQLDAVTNGSSHDDLQRMLPVTTTAGSPSTSMLHTLTHVDDMPKQGPQSSAHHHDDPAAQTEPLGSQSSPLRILPDNTFPVSDQASPPSAEVQHPQPNSRMGLLSPASSIHWQQACQLFRRSHFNLLPEDLINAIISQAESDVQQEGSTHTEGFSDRAELHWHRLLRRLYQVGPPALPCPRLTGSYFPQEPLPYLPELNTADDQPLPDWLSPFSRLDAFYRATIAPHSALNTDVMRIAMGVLENYVKGGLQGGRSAAHRFIMCMFLHHAPDKQLGPFAPGMPSKSAVDRKDYEYIRRLATQLRAAGWHAHRPGDVCLLPSQPPLWRAGVHLAYMNAMICALNNTTSRYGHVWALTQLLRHRMLVTCGQRHASTQEWTLSLDLPPYLSMSTGFRWNADSYFKLQPDSALTDIDELYGGYVLRRDTNGELVAIRRDREWVAGAPECVTCGNTQGGCPAATATARTTVVDLLLEDQQVLLPLLRPQVYEQGALTSFSPHWGWLAAGDPESDMRAALQTRRAALQLERQLPPSLEPEQPCIVNLNLWNWDAERCNEPLSSARLQIPRAVLCSEMGTCFSQDGRYLAVCVAVEQPSERCLQWLQGQGYLDDRGHLPGISERYTGSCTQGPAEDYLIWTRESYSCVAGNQASPVGVTHTDIHCAHDEPGMDEYMKHADVLLGLESPVSHGAQQQQAVRSGVDHQPSGLMSFHELAGTLPDPAHAATTQQPKRCLLFEAGTLAAYRAQPQASALSRLCSRECASMMTNGPTSPPIASTSSTASMTAMHSDRACTSGTTQPDGCSEMLNTPQARQEEGCMPVELAQSMSPATSARRPLLQPYCGLKYDHNAFGAQLMHIAQRSLANEPPDDVGEYSLWKDAALTALEHPSSKLSHHGLECKGTWEPPIAQGFERHPDKVPPFRNLVKLLRANDSTDMQMDGSLRASFHNMTSLLEARRVAEHATAIAAHTAASNLAACGYKDNVSKEWNMYELRIYSLDKHNFGHVVAARPMHAAHCLTSLQFSPTGHHLLLSFGRKHASLAGLLFDKEQVVPLHNTMEIYRVSDLCLVRQVPVLDDEVNVAAWSPVPGGGLLYGTKEGKLRLFRHDRRDPSRAAVPVPDRRVPMTGDRGAAILAALRCGE